MTQFIRNIFLLIFISLTLIRCHFNARYVNLKKDKADAEIVSNKLYELLKVKDYQSTISLFTKKFLEITSKEKLFEIYSVANKKLGDLKETKIKSWETISVEGSDPYANYLLVYQNNYEKFGSEETIRLTREDDGKIRITLYRINSDGFLK